MRSLSSWDLLVPFGVVVAVCVCPCALGATLRVPSEYATIQAAIDAAAPGDVVAVAAGTYTGVGNVGIRFLGKTVTVRSESGPERTVLDGDHRSAPIVRFRDYETSDAVLDGFTITNAYGFEWSGGAFYFENGAGPTIRNCLIAGNRVGGEHFGIGGGIYCRDGSVPVFVACTIGSNRATSATPGGDGDGVYCDDGATVHLVRSVVYANCGSDGVVAGNDGTIYFECCVVDTTQVMTQSGGVVEYLGENVFTDPLFCGDPDPCPEAPINVLDYRVDATSPCMPLNNPCGVQIGALGVGCPSAAADQEWLLGSAGSVRWIGPNPTARHLWIELDLPLPAETIGVRIFDVLGKQVGAIDDRRLGPGTHRLEWSAVGPGGRHLPSGVYFVKLRVGRSERAHSFVIAR